MIVNKFKFLVFQSLLSLKGETIHDKQDIVNSFNEHFVNLFNLISRPRFNPESFSHLKQHLDVLMKGRVFNIDIYIYQYSK